MRGFSWRFQMVNVEVVSEVLDREPWSIRLRREHEVVEGEWIRWVRREFGYPDLCVVHNWRTGTWVLAQWVDRGNGYLQELEVMKGCPDRGYGWTRGTLKWRLRPQAELDLDGRAMRQEVEHQKREAAIRTQMSRDDAVRHLKRKGDQETAMAVSMGAWSDPMSPEQDLVKQEMIPKGKVVTHG
jgi:hypothetical protein